MLRETSANQTGAAVAANKVFYMPVFATYFHQLFIHIDRKAASCTNIAEAFSEAAIAVRPARCRCCVTLTVRKADATLLASKAVRMEVQIMKQNLVINYSLSATKIIVETI